MSLAKLELTEESRMVFDVKITGTDESVSDYRFIIKNEDFNIVCKGKMTEEGVEVKIPKLKGILSDGVYQTALEIIIDDKIFTPLHESIELLPNIEMKVETKTLDNERKQKVSVEVGKATIKSAIQEAKEAGYSIVSGGGKTILKNSEGYIGAVIDDEPLFIGEAQEFLYDFLEEFYKKYPEKRGE